MVKERTLSRIANDYEGSVTGKGNAWPLGCVAKSKTPPRVKSFWKESPLHPLIRWLVLSGVLAVLFVGTLGLAQTESETSNEKPTPATTETESAESEPETLGWFGILAQGGIVGFLILVLSVATVALAIEHALSLRRTVLMPPGLAESVQEMLKRGQVTQAVQQCKLQPSFLAHVLEAGIAEIETGWNAMEKAMEESLADQAGRLYRKVDWLSVIGNIAPMLGLLGTVVGMIFAFKEVAETQGAARAADLAGGIYLALVTTVEGLVVAIPAMGAFALFRNWADQLVSDVGYLATQVFAPLRRARRQQTPAKSQASAGNPGQG